MDEPVDTRELLDEVTAQFGKYIIVHDRAIAPIIPLWICFAWVHDIATYSPILIFESADTGEAKTAASKVVALLTPRAYIIVEPTGPAFYRFVDRVRPTLIVDDADRLLPQAPIWLISSTLVGRAASQFLAWMLAATSIFSIHFARRSSTALICWRTWSRQCGRAASPLSCCRNWKTRKLPTIGMQSR